jgi:hypothetical protein
MSEMGMVERVARALCRESEIYPEDQWERLADWARAALEAMREPTIDMTEAGYEAYRKADQPALSTSYKAMIDAALTTSPST